MSWLKPLDGRSWLLEPAKQPEDRKSPDHFLRTVGGVRATLGERINKARQLEKTHSRGAIAKIMNVDPSTVTKWLGAKHMEKRRLDRGGW